MSRKLLQGIVAAADVIVQANTDRIVGVVDFLFCRDGDPIPVSANRYILGGRAKVQLLVFRLHRPSRIEPCAPDRRQRHSQLVRSSWLPRLRYTYSLGHGVHSVQIKMAFHATERNAAGSIHESAVEGITETPANGAKQSRLLVPFAVPRKSPPLLLSTAEPLPVIPAPWNIRLNAEDGMIALHVVADLAAAKPAGTIERFLRGNRIGALRGTVRDAACAAILTIAAVYTDVKAAPVHADVRNVLVATRDGLYMSAAFAAAAKARRRSPR